MFAVRNDYMWGVICLHLEPGSFYICHGGKMTSYLHGLTSQLVMSMYSRMTESN